MLPTRIWNRPLHDCNFHPTQKQHAESKLPTNMQASVVAMWHDFNAANSDSQRDSALAIPAWHFCDNPVDACECARLVLLGLKRATALSFRELELAQQPIPQVNDLNIVTDWAGVAQCVIQTTRVQQVRFGDVGEELAKLEGEGDGSRAHWLARSLAANASGLLSASTEKR